MLLFVISNIHRSVSVSVTFKFHTVHICFDVSDDQSLLFAQSLHFTSPLRFFLAREWRLELQSSVLETDILPIGRLPQTGRLS